MTFNAEYAWLESYLDNDSFWLDDVLAWDKAADMFMEDFNIFFFLTSPFFVNSHFFLDSITKMSFLDILLFSESDSYNDSREMFDFVMWDLFSYMNNNLLFMQFIFYDAHQDFAISILHDCPELALAISDFFNSYWLNYIVSFLPSAVLDVFSDSLQYSSSEFGDYLVMYAVFINLLILAAPFIRFMGWNNPLEAYAARVKYWISFSAHTYRWELTAAFTTFFLIFLYLTMAFMVWDDDQEESTEGFNGLMFNFFLLMLAYYTAAHSTHALSFIESSIAEGRTFKYVLTQFVRDMSNTLAFVLRYIILIARLNIYDLNDDILDSYYIFLGDFDDDEYFMETFFCMWSNMFFDTDNNDDRSFFLEDEVDLSADLFSLYFIMCGKFALFHFFGLEEVARIGLALSITYLMVFESQSLSRTYVEDDFFTSKRKFFNSFVTTDPSKMF